MKRHFSLLFLLLAIIYMLYAAPVVSALDFPSGHAAVQVEASIGQFYLNLSGYIAPYASVVMVVDGVVYRSVVADSTGHFFISQVLVKRGFSHFCLDAVDVKRLGESEACFNIPPVQADYSKTEIFLPPTIGLFRTQIQVGTNAVIWGYSMPGAVVRIRFPDGTIYTVTAGKDGYYEVRPKILKPGEFQLFADATLAGKQSENPVKGVTLKAVTAVEEVAQNFWDWLKKLFTFLFNLPLGPLWLALPVIILIFILWRKLRQTGVGNGPGEKAAMHSLFDFFKKKRKLHHFWMKGVGY